METTIIHQSLLPPHPPSLSPLLPMPLPEIYYSHSVIYFLQTCHKGPLPVLKELAGSQGFNDWGLVQWRGGEARGSVRIHPPPTPPNPTPGDPGGMTHMHKLPPPPHPYTPTLRTPLPSTLSLQCCSTSSTFNVLPYLPLCCFCSFCPSFPPLTLLHSLPLSPHP